MSRGGAGPDPAGAPLLLERRAVAAAVVLTCVLFTPSTADPVNVVKLTALVLVALVLLVAGTARVLRRREVVLPVSAATAAATALAGALLVSALTAPVRTTAVLGAYGRNSGLLAYLAALLVLLVAARALGRTGTRELAAAVVLAGLFTASYGLLQRGGVDAVSWNNPFNPVIAALGNPNFASGYLGIAGTVAVGSALVRSGSGGWRLTCAVTAVLCLVAAVVSSSVQGPVAATAGLSVVAAAWLLDQPGRRRTTGLAALGTAALAAGALLLAGAVAQAGPAARLFTDAGSRARGYYWEAAWTMFRDRPLLGVGLDHYGSFWDAARSEQSLRFLPGSDYSDAAHSVPLQMLAQGGLLLGLCYAAFVVAVAVALVRGLLRLRGSDRMLLAAVGGGWVAYQVQSSVSIDQVPLLVLHFALAGGVVAVSGQLRLHVVRLPGAPAAPAPPPVKAGRRRRTAAPVPREREHSGADQVVLAGVGLLALVAAYVALAPLRADRAVKSADEQAAAGAAPAADAAYARAIDLTPGRPMYWLKRAGLLEQVTPPQPARAQAAYEGALDADPRDLVAVRSLARIAQEQGDVEAARRYHERALAISPLQEDVVLAAAELDAASGEERTALALLEEAADRPASSARLWTALGRVQAQVGDVDAARAAFERALALDPGSAPAREGLSALS